MQNKLLYHTFKNNLYHSENFVEFNLVQMAISSLIKYLYENHQGRNGACCMGKVKKYMYSNMQIDIK